MPEEEVIDPPYKVNQQVLADFSATVQAKPNLTKEELFKKFPEFNNDEKFLQSALDYSSTSLSGKYKTVEELNSKFPEFDFNIEKKNGVGSNGSVPSTSQSTSQEGIDVKAEAQKFEQARSGGLLGTINEVAKLAALSAEVPKQVKAVDPKLAAKYPIVKNYNGNELRFKNQDEVDYYEKINGIKRAEPKVPKEAHPFNFERFTPQELKKSPQPEKPKIPKTHPFHWDRFITEKSAPMTTSLDEAHKEDSNRANYVWNKFVNGIGRELTQGASLHISAMSKVLPESILGGTSEEVQKIYREQIFPQIKTSLREGIGAEVSPEQEAQYNDEFWTSAIGGLGETGPAILSPKGTKGIALFLQGTDMGMELINSSEEGKKLPEDFKTGFGITVGTAQGLLEKYGLDKIFGKMSTKVASNLAIKTLKDLVKKSEGKPINAEVLEQALEGAFKTLKKRTLDAAGKIGRAGIVEFATGTAQETSTVLLEQLANAVTNKPVFEKVSIFDKPSMLDATVRILYSGAQEAVGGGILGVASVPFNTTRNYISEKVAAAKTPEDIAALKNELMEIAVKENFAPEQTAALEQTIDNYVKVKSKVPPEANNQKEVFDNIIERDDLHNQIREKEKQLAVVDDAFKPELRNEISALKARMDSLNKEIAGEAETEEPPLTQAEEKVKSSDALSALTKEEQKEWGDLSMDEKLALAKENLPQVSELSNLDIIKTADTRAKELLAARDLPVTRPAEEIDEIIKMPVPEGNVKRAEVMVKSINPKTKEVTLQPLEAKYAIVQMKKQIGVIDMIKKCL